MKKTLLVLLFLVAFVPAGFSETVYLGNSADGRTGITFSVQDMFVGEQIDTFWPVQIRPAPVSLYARLAQKIISKEIGYNRLVCRILFWLTRHRLSRLLAPAG